MANFRFHGGYVASLPYSLTFLLGTYGNCMDRFNHFWVCCDTGAPSNSQIRVIDETGAIIFSTDQRTLMDTIGTYALAHEAPGTSYGLGSWTLFDAGMALNIVTLGGVSYAIAHLSRQKDAIGLSHYNYVCAVFIVNSDGTLTLQGVAWTPAPQNAVNQICLTSKIDLAKTKTIDDQILVTVANQIASSAALNMGVVVFPPISTIIGIASAVTTEMLVYPSSNYDGFGDTSMNSGVGADGPGHDQASFYMPNAAGGTDLLIYVCARTMSVTGIPYLVGLQATYPGGVMVKAALPAVVPVLTTGTPARTDVVITPGPALGCFKTATGSAYDAFTDVALYYNGSAGPATLDYYGVPRVITKEADGTFTVGWYAPWFTDDSYVGGAWTVKEKLRIMNYDPATAVFTDVNVLRGPTVNITQLGSAFGSTPDFLDINGWAVFQEGRFLKLWHMNGTSATGSARFVTWLSDIGAIPRTADVWSNIGPPQLAHTRP